MALYQVEAQSWGSHQFHFHRGAQENLYGKVLAAGERLAQQDIQLEGPWRWSDLCYTFLDDKRCAWILHEDSWDRRGQQPSKPFTHCCTRQRQQIPSSFLVGSNSHLQSKNFKEDQKLDLGKTSLHRSRNSFHRWHQALYQTCHSNHVRWASQAASLLNQIWRKEDLLACWRSNSNMQCWYLWWVGVHPLFGSADRQEPVCDYLDL